MSAPRWASALLRRLAPLSEADVLIGDLDEAHHARVVRRGRVAGVLLTALEVADIAAMLVRRRMQMPRVTMSWLDLKLAARMLVRYPVLTAIGTGSLAAGIALGAAAFAVISLTLWPKLPLPEGDRIVNVAIRDVAGDQGEPRIVADYLRWRAGTSTLTDFVAGRGRARNLAMGDGTVESINVEEITASMFPMTRVAPIMGRALTDKDAEAAAPAVMVIGERLWRERFAADPAIVGKTLLVSDAPTTVVGVMPAEFKFPSNFEVWQPLKINESSVQPRVGMGIGIWARLKPGVTYELANAELASLSAQSAADWPATHEHLRASVLAPAKREVRDPTERKLLASVNLFVALLVLLVSGNVALLMFARAATRESEIVVRTALGASRGRLIAQFLAEAIVLSAIAAVLGLVLAERTMAWGVTTFSVVANGGEQLPFWFTPRLPPMSIAYGVGLALMAAAVTGILPALKMTRGLSDRLRQSSAGGGGLSFGGVWTVITISQITVTMVFPFVMFFLTLEARRTEHQDIGVPADRYLTAQLGRESQMSPARYEAAVRRIEEDLAKTPGIAGVAVADKLPLMWNGHYIVEIEGGSDAPREAEFGSSYRVTSASVQPDFFTVFEASAMAGRLLAQADFVAGSRAVVVNQSFVEKVLGGRNAVGRRFRYMVKKSEGVTVPAYGEDTVWFEIVGVVRDMGMALPPAPNTAGIYMPINLRSINAVYLAARVTGNMTEAANALRSIARNADSTLRLADVKPLIQVPEPDLRTMRTIVRILGIVGAVGLMLALSGIYAVMSFSVSRRTREIGIRMALGSTRPRVILSILRGPMIQVAIGSVLGATLIHVLPIPIPVTASYAIGMIGYAAGMFGICLLASVVPVRRALRVDPITALRAE
jgi:putative ABC transport system permease protein